jgi:prepilin-type N-terminal cleavage/methylation domain-containing protein
MDPHAAADRERGFTIIELMTVVMIIAVLIAILIPNFLKARRPAQDRQAQSLLREGLTTAAEAGTDAPEPPDASALATADPALHFVGAATAAQARERSISVATGTSSGTAYLLLASHSSSGRCYAVLARAEAAPRYQRVDADACTAADFDPGSGWSDSWP